MRFPDGRVLIFAKAPRAGRVKRRLEPAIGPPAAARLQARLLTSVVERLAAARIAPLELHCAPDAEHPLFAYLARRHALVGRAQVTGDLGRRMGHAARLALTECERLVLIGADCPGLDGDYLTALLERLGPDCPAVLGPAEDGGYVALGLRRMDSRLFERIDWGTDRVLAQTRQRLEEMGWRYAMLPPLWDVDRPADLERLRRYYPELAGDRPDDVPVPDQALASE